MIIDVETQVWNNPGDLGLPLRDWHIQRDMEPWYSLDASGDAHDRAMDCVDIAIVSGFKSLYLNAHIPAESVASFVGKAPRRRLGFAGIDPMSQTPIDDLHHAVSLGLVGITIAPAAQNYHPTHSTAMPIYEECQKLGLPILIKLSTHLTVPATILEYARPSAFDEVARSFPNLKILLGQFGSPWHDETMLLIAKHANVYTNLAGIVSKPWSLYNLLVKAAEYGVMDKILFASNFPHETPEHAIKRIYSLNNYSHGTELPSISRGLLRGIVQRDALNCLGLDRPEGASISKGIGAFSDTIQQETPKQHSEHNTFTRHPQVNGASPDVVRVSQTSSLYNDDSEGTQGN